MHHTWRHALEGHLRNGKAAQRESSWVGCFASQTSGWISGGHPGPEKLSPHRSECRQFFFWAWTSLTGRHGCPRLEGVSKTLCASKLRANLSLPIMWACREGRGLDGTSVLRKLSAFWCLPSSFAAREVAANCRELLRMTCTVEPLLFSLGTPRPVFTPMCV